MNHSLSTPQGAIRTAVRKFSIAVYLLAIGFSPLLAQNSSSNTDGIPLAGGSFNAGYGIGVLTPVTGSNNTAVGYRALTSNAAGSNNVGVGYFALASNGAGGPNTAIGTQTLELALNSTFNTALGFQVLRNSSTASQNTAAGHQAMFLTTTGSRNAAFGIRALTTNSTGASNAALGAFALTNNTIGNENTGLGREALFGNTTGLCNTGVGFLSLSVNTTGSNNTGLGCQSNVSIPGLGNATAIGNGAIVNADNKVRVGNAAVTVIEGQVAFTFPSDGRFKTNVRAEDVVGLEFIQRLRPVVYNFETRRFTEFLTQNMPDSLRQRYLADDFGPSTAIRQSGFIAQEVEQAAREVGYDFNGVHVPTDAGDNYSVAYSQFVVPLVKAVQEQQAMISTQAEQIATQQKELAELKAIVRTLAGAQGDATKQSEAVEVFPNPSAGRFTLRIAPLEKGHLEVYDQQGKQVHFSTVSPGQSEYTIDLSGLASGSYLLRLHSPGGLVATKQLVVK
jgi:trimeric autotransporter adhesin